MGMFSEIAAEGEVLAYSREIARMMKEETNPDAIRAFKKVGRYALTRFDWTAPEWAAEYEKLFEE